MFDIFNHFVGTEKVGGEISESPGVIYVLSESDPFGKGLSFFRVFREIRRFFRNGQRKGVPFLKCIESRGLFQFFFVKTVGSHRKGFSRKKTFF